MTASEIGKSEIRKVFSQLSYKRDARKPPDNLRCGQFRAGWKRDEEIGERTLNEKLTWHNLGYRMGQHFGPRSDEQIDQVFQILADDYRSDATPPAKKVASKAAKKVGTRRQRSTERKSENRRQTNYYPDEIDINASLPEGAKQQVTVNAYERNRKARELCIKKYKAKCCICGFSFGDTYDNEYVKDFIHVHHLKPLSEIGERYAVDPVQDLRPVCPNCHAVIHRREPAFSIEEVRAFLQRGKSR